MGLHQLKQINVTFRGQQHVAVVQEPFPFIFHVLLFHNLGRWKSRVPCIDRPQTVDDLHQLHQKPAPLIYALEKLYLGENRLTDNAIQPLTIFNELKALNLSFNEIQDLLPNFFHNIHRLEELYLSGNKLTSIPAEDFPGLTRLHTLFLNGNKLHTLLQELGKVGG